MMLEHVNKLIAQTNGLGELFKVTAALAAKDGDLKTVNDLMTAADQLENFPRQRLHWAKNRLEKEANAKAAAVDPSICENCGNPLVSYRNGLYYQCENCTDPLRGDGQDSADGEKPLTAAEVKSMFAATDAHRSTGQLAANDPATYAEKFQREEAQDGR